MNGPGRRFDPAELTDENGVGPPDPERLAVAAIAREIEGVAARDAGGVDGFTDRVMATVAAEPAPQPIVALESALRKGRVRASLAAVRDAWRVALGAGRPIAVRGQALALGLIVLAGVLGVTGGAVVGAARLLAPDNAPSPTPVLPTPGPSPSPDITVPPSPSPTPTPLPTDSPEATETPEPTETPEESDDHGGDRTPRATDDSSGSSGSGSSGSGSSGSGSGED